jgi:tetratricopeptide (TPR) repeat protein
MKIQYYLALLIVPFFIKCTSVKNASFYAATTPSKIELPANVNSIKILNRTRPLKRSVGQVLNGQISYVDRPGVKETIIGFRNEVRNRKYFTIPSATTTKTIKSVQSNEFPKKVEIDQLLDLYGAGNLVASLEIFNVYERNQFIPETKMQLDTNGREYYINITRGIKTLEATTGWRLYNSETGVVIDEFILNHDNTYNVEGINRQNAADKMEVRIPQAYKDLGSILGFEYANRISPTKHFVGRTYFSKSKSCPQLKEAIDFIRLKDWETAKQIWLDGLSMSVEASDISRLHHNLGVYYERAGNLDKAIEELEKAKQNKTSKEKNYVTFYLSELKRVKRYGYQKM